MKRSRLDPGTKGLNPGKGFKPRTSQLRSRGALVRQSAMTRTAAKPRKPLVSKPKHDPTEAPARKALRARSGGVCEMDGRNPAVEAHHRQNRSQGGQWEIPNLLHLCSEHHRFVTVNPAVACERGWSVRSTHNPADVPVWLAGRGWSYLTADGGIVPTERSAA